MEEKRCSKCRKYLPVNQFSLCRPRKSKLSPQCKQCQREYYINNKEQRSQYSKKWRETHPDYSKDAGKKARAEWEKYLIKRYGLNPECEICGKQLSWPSSRENYKKNFHELVTFDHRNGGDEYIKLGPSSWKNQAFNLKNIKIWESCDFGILCQRCNVNLPTNLVKRREKLTRFIAYLNKCGA